MFGFLMMFVMTSRKMSDPNGHDEAITEIHNSPGKPKGTFWSDTSTGANVVSAGLDSMLSSRIKLESAKATSTISSAHASI